MYLHGKLPPLGGLYVASLNLVPGTIGVYRVAGDRIARSVTVDSTIAGPVKRTQTVHMYEDYVAPAVEMPVTLNRAELEGLDPDMVMQLVAADRKEAEEAGLYFPPDKGTGERYTLTGAELAALKAVLNRAGPARGNAISGSQMVWREIFTYDRNGNRASKTTPWGTIRYEYDAENRLIKKGDIIYTNDKDGNTLTEKGIRYEANYRYNGQNRMVYSEVTSHVEKTHTVSSYGYDALGRRVITESITGETVRTLYDGKGFEVIREGVTFKDGSFTTRFAPGGITANGNGSGIISNQPTGERYRWISEEGSGRVISEDGYTTQGGRATVIGVTLYGKGEAIAVNYNSSVGGRGVYLGKDILGSVRSTTGEMGTLEERYEYDAFGTPYQGDLGGGMNLGYTGKPYDAGTGLYNYGYRDYKPEAARFTTVDPIRDGNNWFAYVNNDPVNYLDLWGLAPRNLSDEQRDAYMQTINSYSDYNRTTNDMGLPNGYDCADVAAYLYNEAMSVAGVNNAAGQLQHGGTNITSIPQIESKDFFPDNPNNITYYDDKSFNNPNVEAGSVAVWAGPGASTGAGWTGHVATVVDVVRDEKGNVVSINTIEGHTGGNKTAVEYNSQTVWNTYAGDFLGFGEIGKNSTTPNTPAIPNASGSKGE
ncbi:hypothetical protein AGMMS50293_06070 [Spirochaetia bacterium]|nr:hypothetical protein AGMMS50293_06070 [Spirochaetia bacterium]